MGSRRPSIVGERRHFSSKKMQYTLLSHSIEVQFEDLCWLRGEASRRHMKLKTHLYFAANQALFAYRQGKRSSLPDSLMTVPIDHPEWWYEQLDTHIKILKG